MQALSKNPKECIYLLYHDRNITAMCVVGFKSEQRFQYSPILPSRTSTGVFYRNWLIYYL